MSQAGARVVAPSGVVVSHRAAVAVVEEAEVGSGKCTLRLVRVAVPRRKFLSCPGATGLSIATPATSGNGSARPGSSVPSE